MTLKVTMSLDLTKEIRDLLQQNVWEFPISFEEEDPMNGLPKDEVGLPFVTNEGVFVGTGPGVLPLEFSWTHHLRFWRIENQKTPAKKSSLFKAVSPAGQVVDATCGFGRDCAFFLSTGQKVLAFERNELVFFCLKAASLLEELDHVSLELCFGSYDGRAGFEVPIYFDPMYEGKEKKKAKSKKTMDTFQGVIRGDDDAETEAGRLLELTQRLVIKRAPRGDLLLKNRNSCWESKAVRFDLYLNQKTN